MIIRSSLAFALILVGSSAMANPVAGGKIYACSGGGATKVCTGTRVLVGPNGGTLVSTINKVKTPNYKRVTKTHNGPHGGTVRITKVRTR